MVVELAAARMLTPCFGQTIFVWTNVIGVILASIAAGNYVGGRMADASASFKPLFILLSAAGFLSLAAPWLLRWTADAFLGEDLQLEEAFSLLVKGSFCTTVIVFAPPVFLLGMILPFVIKAAAANYGAVGRASGTIYAASTLGSITGTFLTTYCLVELLGSRGTFYAAGLFLILIAGAGFFLFGRGAGKWGGGVLVIAAAGLHFFCPEAGGFSESAVTRKGDRIVWEKESRYQYITVVESGDAPGTFFLRVNEGLDSFQSIYIDGQILTDGQYYDYFTLLPLLAGKGSAGDVLIIGLAAGTIARQYAFFFGSRGGLQIDGVEIDPLVIEAGRRYMDLSMADPFLKIYSDVDGRVFLDAVEKRYDVIVADAYSEKIHIPFHLATKEFFQSAYDRLKPGGVFGLNVSGFDRSDPVVEAVANTASLVFGSVSLARVPLGRNYMLYAVKGKGHVPPSDCDPSLLPPGLVPLLEKIGTYGLTRRVAHDPRLPILTDDRAPLEMMCDRDLVRRSKALIDSLQWRRQ